MTFADHLREARLVAGLSQSEAAERIEGLSVRTLQAWEGEKQTPPLWAQHLILKTLRARRSASR